MPTCTLTTERLVLRPPSLQDSEAVYTSYARDPDVARYGIWTPHTSLAETYGFLRDFIASADREDSYPWVMTLRQDRTVIGAMHLRVHRPWAEFGFNIARLYWNRGFGTEAVRAVIAFGLALPRIERVQAVCHVENEASRRVMEKSGMRLEGVLRRYLVFPNLGQAAQDVLMHAVTRDDVAGGGD